MELNVTELYQMQEILDQRIFDEHGITRLETGSKRVLALLVEVGELANETRCFKFWSLKPASPREITLEEYVDGIHFILSIGLDLKDSSQSLKSSYVVENLTTAFLYLYKLIAELQENYTLSNYYKVADCFLAIGHSLGYSLTEIKDYYLLKNKKNHQRQDEGY